MALLQTSLEAPQALDLPGMLPKYLLDQVGTLHKHLLDPVGTLPKHLLDPVGSLPKHLRDQTETGTEPGVEKVHSPTQAFIHHLQQVNQLLCSLL